MTPSSHYHSHTDNPVNFVENLKINVSNDLEMLNVCCFSGQIPWIRSERLDLD